MTDDSWSMVEQAVFRLFGELAGKPGTAHHVTIGPRLAQLGWSDIEAEYPTEACELPFRAQGRSLVQTDSLSRVMLAELAAHLQLEALLGERLFESYSPGSASPAIVACS